MKKQLFLLLSVLILASSSALAYDFSAVAPTGQTLYYHISGDTATVIYPSVHSSNPWSSFTMPTGDLAIPASVTHNSQTYSVTSIGDYAFSGCSGLTSLSIPNSITSIGDYAFCGCSGLTSLSIPNSVNSIGWGTFGDCSGLTSLSIPNSVTSIGYYAFCDCSGLTSLSIPNSVNSIGYYAFSGCSGLTSLYIPNSVTSIGDYAFSGCSGLTSVTIPNSVTHIGYYAFDGVKVVNYCGSATGSPWEAQHAGCFYEEGDFIYQDDTKTTLIAYIGSDSIVTIPNSVTSIGWGAFYNCSGLTSVTIPNTVTSIGNSAFYGCSGLTSLTIPNFVTSIGDYAFYRCSGLTSLTIPNFVTSIGEYAFCNCSGLTSVTYNATNCTTMGRFYPYPYPVFSNCTNLSSLTIGDSVQNIPPYAFYGCSGLTSITSEAYLAPQLGADAFTGVSSTIPVNIPCGSNMSYFSRWSYFSNFVEEAGFTFNASTSDSARGSVQILTEPTCTNPEAVIYAAANTGYLFDHWSDGVTDNPRRVVLISDTSLIAYFVSSDGIGDINKNHFIITANNSQIVISNAANQRIRIFDNIGRLISTTLNTEETSVFNMPSSGVYLVQVGNAPAQRVVVVN